MRRIIRLIHWYLFRFSPRVLAKAYVNDYGRLLLFHPGVQDICQQQLLRKAAVFDVPELEKREHVGDAWNPPTYYTRLRTRDVHCYETVSCFITAEGVAVSEHGISVRQFIYATERNTITPAAVMQKRMAHVSVARHKVVAVIHDRWSMTNYYHWLTETLVKWYLLKDLDEYADIPIAVPEHCPAFVRESLQLLEPHRPLVTIPNHGMIWAERSVHVDYSRLSGTHDPKLVRAVADHVVTLAAGHQAAQAHRRIYISRKAAGTRHIVNEEELLPVMADHGVEMVDMARLDFVQQVRLMSECGLLIGPHGAGLTNAMFMPKGAKVIEVTTTDKLREPGLRYCFYSLLSTLGLEYVPVTGVSVDTQDANANIMLSSEYLEPILVEY